MRSLPAVIAAIIAVIASYSCSTKEKNSVAEEIDPENFATMTSTAVSTLISDSGITRYRIDTPLWLVYDQASEPRWNFPDGLHLEKYDDFFRVDATVDCDSAVYFKDRQLWRLDGYVDIRNVAEERFLTQQLYWDQRDQKIYSDSFIHIERADRTIEGYGFISNDNLTEYRVVNVSGIFPASQESGGTVVQSDTATVAPVGNVQGSPGLRPQPARSSVRHASSATSSPAVAPAPEPSHVVRPSAVRSGQRPASGQLKRVTTDSKPIPPTQKK